MAILSTANKTCALRLNFGNLLSTSISGTCWSPTVSIQHQTNIEGHNLTSVHFLNNTMEFSFSEKLWRLSVAAGEKNKTTSNSSFKQQNLWWTHLRLSKLSKQSTLHPTKENVNILVLSKNRVRVSAQYSEVILLKWGI